MGRSDGRGHAGKERPRRNSSTRRAHAGAQEDGHAPAPTAHQGQEDGRFGHQGAGAGARGALCSRTRRGAGRLSSAAAQRGGGCGHAWYSVREGAIVPARAQTHTGAQEDDHHASAPAAQEGREDGRNGHRGAGAGARGAHCPRLRVEEGAGREGGAAQHVGGGRARWHRMGVLVGAT
jgi:hypothetical protein